MPYLTLRDSTQLYYKDWGNPSGPAVLLSHGWPLNADNWENQAFFLANNGCRVIAHDRRRHGRSDQPWHGNDIDTWADDLNELIEHLSLNDVMLAGHSTGGGEIVRYCARHGTGKVKKLVLVSAVPPLLVKTPARPNGVPIEVFDSFRAAMEKNRSAFFLEVPTGPSSASTAPVQRPVKASSTVGGRRSWETDFREDFKNLDIPVLVIHGDDDQVVPVAAGGLESIKLLKNGKLKVYKGGPHALPNIEIDGINNDLLEFLKE